MESNWILVAKWARIDDFERSFLALFLIVLKLTSFRLSEHLWRLLFVSTLILDVYIFLIIQQIQILLFLILLNLIQLLIALWIIKGGVRDVDMTIIEI